MFTVILFLIFGLIAGFLLRKKQQLSPKVNFLINAFIYLLLFTLGLNAGSDNRIISRLHTLGLTAATISLFTISGSIFVAWLTYKYILKKHE